MINILLATFNGELYLEEQLDSLLSQTVQDFHIIISDDGSTDGSVDIINKYEKKYNDKISVYHSGKRFGCAGSHFIHLLTQYCDSDYIMFCDQDDVWHPDKIEKTLTEMRKIESQKGGPVMIHSDLCVVDSMLNEIDTSYMHMMHLDYKRTSISQVLVQTVATGCTMMINKELAEQIVQHLPNEEIIGHDSWINRVAALVGTIGFVQEPLIDYRQHAHNSIGAENISLVKHIKRYIISGKELIFETFGGAEVLLRCYGSILPQEKINLLNIYKSMPNYSSCLRKYYYVRYGFLKNQLLKRIAQIIFE